MPTLNITELALLTGFLREKHLKNSHPSSQTANYTRTMNAI